MRIGRATVGAARRGSVLGAVAALVAALIMVGSPAAAVPPKTVPPPDQNPGIEKACGIDVTLVLDASGSVQSSNAVSSVRAAAAEFLDALKDTNSRARVLQFGTFAAELASRQLVDGTNLGQDGELTDAVAKYYNPRPPRPATSNMYRYNGNGSPTNSGSWSLQNSSSNDQYTNWQQALNLTADDAGELTVFITDGDPTAYDFDQPGDPFRPQDAGFSTDRGEAFQQTLNRSVQAANAVKATDSRVLAIGVGEALQNPASVDRLTLVSGPHVARSIDDFDIETTDVALVPDFDDLAQAVRALVLDLCSPSLTIKKLAQTADNGNYLPAGGWDFTVTPTVPEGFDWVLPTGATGASATVTTNGDGLAPFQWEPAASGALSDATVSEALEPNYIAGRPEGDDWSCQFKDVDGNTRTVSGELTGGANPSFGLLGIGAEIGTCTVWNSYDYDPEIAIEKVNAPTEVRGDLDPATPVTSSYTVTNPGNTPLSNVVVTDDKCGPVSPGAGAPNPGDANGNRLLDPGEVWLFSCTRTILERGRAASVLVDNTAEVVGLDPAGTLVDDTATDDVEIFVPAITLTKLVDGQPSVIIQAPGTEVTYTYAATNTGNTPLGSVTLVDDKCASPIRGPDPNGNEILDVGETWNYTCTALVTENVLNTATVTGTPLNPRQTNAPFPDLNPPVTDTDTASVTVVDPDLTLTKVVDRSLVFADTGVTYSYTATNQGDTDLRNDTGAAGWVADNSCAPVNQVVGPDGLNVGDVNGDGLLNAGDPGETWQFTCTTEITQTVLNTATIIAQPVVNSAPTGSPLTRRAFAFVQVVTPEVELVKTALVPVVLDPDAQPVEGPDVPDPRPAEYLYEVGNPGQVPIRDVVLADDTCDDVTFQEGDAAPTGSLDPGEVWIYTCETPLERQQSTTPPLQPGSRISGNVQNTADVRGTSFLPDEPDVDGPEVTDSDIASVTVIEPGITLIKTVSPDVVRVNGEVTYTFRVINTGDVGLQVLGPVDDKCTDLQFVGGDNGNGILEGANGGVAEIWTYTCTREIGLPEDPDLTDVNTATVEGIDPLGNIYQAEDSAEVRVLDPAISLTKTVDETLVPAGTTVNYGFDVTNTGTSPLAADDVLDQITLGDAATPPTPTCTSPSLVSKTGGDQDDRLTRDPFETWHYECSAALQESTTNLAVVGGLGGTDEGLEIPVFDADVASVQVFHPGIAVVKTADPTTLLGGGEVTYTYQVTNTGDVPLSGVADGITDDTCSPVTFVSGDEDGDGLLDTPTSIFEDALDETWIFTCTTTVTETTTNVVTVPGTPTDPDGEPLCGSTQLLQVAEPCDVTDEGSATVTVVDPGSITVVKQAYPDTSIEFPFAFGDESFTLTDGGSRTFDSLAPGEYTVLENASDGWDLAGITCEDPTGAAAVDVAAGSAVITLAGGEDVTCTFTNSATPAPAPAPTVPPDPGGGGTLPNTGLGLTWKIPTLGLALILVGCALVLVVRRRPTHQNGQGSTRSPA